MKNLLKTTWATALLCLLAACTADESDTPREGIPVEVTLKLSAKSDCAATRWADQNALNGEMMKNWFVVVVNSSSNVVEAIIQKNELTTELEEDAVNVTLTTGAKTFYSFANMTQEQAGSPTVGASYSPENNTFTLDNPLSGTIPATGIPMSNSQSITIDDKTAEISLEVIRLMAKIAFTFENQTGNDITIKSITLSDVTTGGLYLLGRGDAESAKVPQYPGTYGSASLCKNFNDLKVIKDSKVPNDSADPAESAESADNRIYLPESSAANGAFSLTLALNKGDGQEEEQRYSVTELAHIWRNDYITIPIVLTDYNLKLKAFTSAPIGGYPEVTVTQDAETTDFYVSFSAEADETLILRPELYTYSSGGETAITLTEQNVTITTTDGKTYTGDDIFTTAPAWNDADEIVATLSGNAGTAVVEITVSKETAAIGGGTNRVLTRRIYITNQNKQ